MEKIKVVIGIIVAAAVIVTAAMWFLLSGKESLGDLLIPTIAVILAITSMKFVWDRAKASRQACQQRMNLAKRQCTRQAITLSS